MQLFADTPKLETFRARYESQPPQRDCQQHELVQLANIDGVIMLQQAPASQVQLGRPSRSVVERGVNTYLWVIDDSGIPYIIEHPLPCLGGVPPKHTNLTGGKGAYAGGEMWFASEERLFLSGGSGRYPPRSEDQLTDATKVFESYQYEVTSLGWDAETGYTKRIYDGD